MLICSNPKCSRKYENNDPFCGFCGSKCVPVGDSSLSGLDGLTELLKLNKDLLLDTKATDSAISELFAHDQIAKNLMLAAYRENIPQKILPAEQITAEVLESYLEILTGKYGAKKDAATKAVETWALALGKNFDSSLFKKTSNSHGKTKIFIGSLVALILLGAAFFYFFHEKQPSQVIFGSYPQTKDGVREPIKWRVLTSENGNLLLLSRLCLDSLPYNVKAEKTTWEKCTLRTWLNRDFYQTAFTPKEQQKIVLANLTTGNNVDFGTPGGNDTQDKVFLLSIEEVRKYFAYDDDMSALPSDYAKRKGCYTNYYDEAYWWLRSLGANATSGALVGNFGGLYNRGDRVEDPKYAVRPAVWVKY